MNALTSLAALLMLTVSGLALAGAPAPIEAEAPTVIATKTPAPEITETAVPAETPATTEAATIENVITPTAVVMPTDVISTAKAAPPTLASSPTTINAKYDVSKGGIRVAVVEESYQRIDDTYTMSSTTRAVGVFSWFKSGKIIVSSSGLIDAHGLRPVTFDGNNENNKDDRKHGEIDWVTKKISVTRGAEPSTLDLPDNTQDRLSAMYQFMFLPLQPQTTTAFPMLNGHYLTELKFEISDGGSVKVPAGEYATLYLDNKIQKKRERTEIWLATAFHNIPVKMVITDDGGGKLTQTLRSLVIEP